MRDREGCESGRKVKVSGRQGEKLGSRNDIGREDAAVSEIHFANDVNGTRMNDVKEMS